MTLLIDWNATEILLEEDPGWTPAPIDYRTLDLDIYGYDEWGDHSFLEH